jgi:NTP pyrophosphatase (non-canonical NTP hydrolase)
MTLQEAQQKVDHWIQVYGGGYFSELTNLGALMEEVGELSRWMVRHYGDQSFKASEKPLDVQAAMQDEIADILWVLLCLSNQMNIDLTTALQQNFEKKTARDKDRHTKRD